jgi:hypothetical protein
MRPNVKRIITSTWVDVESDMQETHNDCIHIVMESNDIKRGIPDFRENLRITPHEKGILVQFE